MQGILCKILEHVVTSNLASHLDKHNLLYDLQHGFREKRSCETQLVSLIDDLSRNLQAGRQTDLVLLDFSKAFDKVNHEKLLHKLHTYGVRGNTLAWIGGFLNERTQKVVLNGVSSSSASVSSGVPQGSVLGPLLFSVYINDLPVGTQSTVRLFADDTAIYLTISKQSDSLTLQKDLDTLQRWEETWDMEFNPSKCQVLHITRARTPVKTQYLLHGQILEPADHVKYLGVDISQKLSWKSHVHRITQNANRSLGFIRRNIKVRNPQVREAAYKTLVRPQLEYASSVWDPYHQEQISKIELVQRRAARWTLNNYAPLASVSDMLSKLGWRSLELRRCDARLALFYKVVHGFVAIPLPSYIVQPSRFPSHSHSHYFRQVQVSRDYYKYSFFSLTIVQWNALPAFAVALPNPDTFRAHVATLHHAKP